MFNFIGKAHRRKSFNGENFPNYGIHFCCIICTGYISYKALACFYHFFFSRELLRQWQLMKQSQPQGKRSENNYSKESERKGIWEKERDWRGQCKKRLREGRGLTRGVGMSDRVAFMLCVFAQGMLMWPNRWSGSGMKQLQYEVILMERYVCQVYLGGYCYIHCSSTWKISHGSVA